MGMHDSVYRLNFVNGKIVIAKEIIYSYLLICFVAWCLPLDFTQQLVFFLENNSNGLFPWFFYF